MGYPFHPDLREMLAERCRAFPRIAHDGEGLKPAAVALTLVAADDGSGEAAFLLTRRAMTLRAHGGQWALPGGRCDPGETAAQAALRELEEELGLALPPEQVLGLLDDYPTRSGYVITPVVAWLDDAAALAPNPQEVASAHSFRLDHIAGEAAVAFETIPESPRPLIRLHLGEHHVHAPTAALIYQLRELVAGRVTRVAHLEQPVFAWALRAPQPLSQISGRRASGRAWGEDLVRVRTWTCTAVALAGIAAASLARAGDVDATTQSIAGVTVVAQRRLDTPMLTQPIAATPQSIDVIPAEVIQLAGSSDLRDVLRLDPSVSAHADEDSGQGTNVQIRGFSARFDLYRDGQLDLGQYYRDPFDLDAVEVLTGPSSVLFGRGSTGGVINDVAKAPLASPVGAAELSGGTDGLARFAADLGAPLAAGVAVRLNAVADGSGTAGRDVVDTRRAGLSPVISVGLGGPTQLTVGLLHQTQWDRPDYGVPWIDIAGEAVSHPAAVPWHDFYGFRDDYSHVTADIATASLRHDLADGWVLHDQFRFASYGRGYRDVEPTIAPLIAPTTPLSQITVTRTVRGGASHEGFLEDQADLTGDFESFGLKHTLVISGEVGQQVSDPKTLSFSGVPGTNLIDPNETQLFSGVAKLKTLVQFTADTAAVSVGDSVALTSRLRFDGDVRLDRFAAAFANAVPTPTTFQHTDLAASYRAALTYALAGAAHAYVMWGTSFDPSAEDLSLSATTADLAPERNETTEAGVKWTPRPSLLLTGALFRTVQLNSREPSPTDPTLTILAGTARAQGVELLAQGRITPRWMVQGGYTYLDAKIVASPNDDLGQPLQNAPKHNLRLFSTYDLSSRLTFGGGVFYQSSRAPGSVPDANGLFQSAPGYVTVSAVARYQLSPHLALQLNADNLADAHDYDGLDDNHINVGAGRSLHVTLIAQR